MIASSDVIAITKWSIQAPSSKKGPAFGERAYQRCSRGRRSPSFHATGIVSCPKCHSTRISDIALLRRKRVFVTVRFVTGDPR